MKTIYCINKNTGELRSPSKNYFDTYLKDCDWQIISKKEYDLCSLAVSYVFDNYC